MPPPIINGVITFLTGTNQLNSSVWDGEVPRQDVAGNPINPESTVMPSNWPVLKVSMGDAGFTRTWTTEDPYYDRGELLIQIWGTSRASVESELNTIEALLSQAANWAQIQLAGGPMLNPYYIVHMLLSSWCSVQEEGVRTQKSELVYRGDMHYDVVMHGAVTTL